MSTALAGGSRRSATVDARVRELTASRAALTGGHRADLRVALELAGLHCADRLAADLDALARRVADDLATRPGGAGFGRRLSGELTAVRLRSEERVAAAAGPAVARVAARLCPGAAPMPLPPPSSPRPELPAHGCPETAARAAAGGDRTGRGAGHRRRPAAGRSRAETFAAVADPRLLAGLVALPVLGAGGHGWAAALWTAGVLVLAGALLRSRLVASDRARCRAELAREVAAAARTAERELHRRFAEIGAAAGSALDRAVAERRSRVDAELAGLRALR